MQRYNNNSTTHIQCPCGIYHGHNSIGVCPASYYNNNYNTKPGPGPYDQYSSSSSVDCTLSLGTPSTRRNSISSGDHRRSSASSNCIPNFCLDFLQTSKHHSTSSHKSSSTSVAAADSTLSRRCANCDTTSTPLWRNGPRGPKSLCNACGIRFKKEERRAAAANATSCGGSGLMMDTWPAHQKLHYSGNDFRFIDDAGGRDSTDGMHFLSWRLNVTDRPTGLVYDFTR